MERVVIADTKEHALSDALDEIFTAFGGLKVVIPSGARIYVRPNAVNFTTQAYADPAVLDALLGYFRDHGYTRLAVMENVTGGNFSRLVFHAVGYTKICGKYDAEAIYLDESPPVEVTLRDEDEPTRIPKRLYDDFVTDREDHFYLNLPKLKTHCMSTVTLGVKKQQAFPIHADRMQRHSHHTLHRRLASIYDLIRPDFCIIDGLNAIYHGHIPISAFVDECVAPMNILIGGRDTSIAADGRVPDAHDAGQPDHRIVAVLDGAPARQHRTRAVAARVIRRQAAACRQRRAADLDDAPAPVCWAKEHSPSSVRPE